MGDKILAVSIIYLTCHFALNVILSGFAGATEGIIFQHRIGQVSDNHTTQVTPSGRTFMIWNLIYVWLLAGYVFLTVQLFRTSGGLDTSLKRYCNPSIFSRVVCWLLIVNSFFYTAWLFIWDNQLMTPSAIFLVLIALSNWAALVIFSKNLWGNVVTLKTESPNDLLAYRVLFLNGLGIYTTWTTLASLINIAVALVYDGGLPEPTPSLIALAFLTMLMTVWTPLELMFWDNYFRYMITPLFVILWALTGIYMRQARHPDIIDESVHNFTIALIIATCCLIVLRTGVIIYRHFRRPLYIGLTMASSA